MADSRVLGGLAAAAACLLVLAGCVEKGKAPPKKLGIVLPEKWNTPDGMTEDKEGNILVSIPNFNKPEFPAKIVKIDKNDNLTEWFSLPPHPVTKFACPLGIAFASDGNLYWADCQDLGAGVAGRKEFQGKNISRLCRIVVENGKPVRSEVVVDGFFMSNAVACRKDCVYVTETNLGIASEKNEPHLSGVYRFKLSELDPANPIKLKTGGTDPHLILKIETKNPDWKVGANGMGFGSKGQMFVCNFGDAQLLEFIVDDAGKVTSKRVVAEGQGMKSVDGLMVDMASDDVYIADFLGSAVHMVCTHSGKVTTLQANPEDNDGSDNKLDKCSECRKRGNKVYASNIDIPFGGNTSDKPYTISVIELK